MTGAAGLEPLAEIAPSAAERAAGRGLHSPTFQLNVSDFRGIGVTAPDY